MVWREFSYHLLWHWPHITESPFNNSFADFPWREDQEALKAWQLGKTGYPIVDAGMRQLWQTGWMHNRVRIIVASFLTKHLLIPWQEGARWFWDTLVDADLANNSASWQWVTGSGADASPYFRIFNPILQGQKFDPEGAYIRQWVPEIAGLSNKHMHAPWESGVWDRGLSGTAGGSQMGKAAFDGCLRGVKGTQAELNDTSGFKDTLFERWVYTSPNCCVRGATAFS